MPEEKKDKESSSPYTGMAAALHDALKLRRVHLTEKGNDLFIIKKRFNCVSISICSVGVQLVLLNMMCRNGNHHRSNGCNKHRTCRQI